MMGVDSIHAGMWGGYLSDSEEDLKITIKELHNHNVVPALSYWIHPGLVQANIRKFGNDYKANDGGAIHGNQGGTFSGA